MLMRSKQIISHSFFFFYKRCVNTGNSKMFVHLIYPLQTATWDLFSEESWGGIFVGGYVDSPIATNRPECETLNQLQFHQIGALKGGEAAP